jgi:hypothetical protein
MSGKTMTIIIVATSCVLVGLFYFLVQKDQEVINIVMSQRASDVDALYASLTPEQQNIADCLADRIGVSGAPCPKGTIAAFGAVSRKGMSSWYVKNWEACADADGKWKAGDTVDLNEEWRRLEKTKI